MSPYANNPSRWLVVFNAGDADSVAVAEDYRLRRGVPEANMLGLDLPGDEVITATQYEALSQGVSDHLAAEGLTDKIVGIVLSYATPSFVQTLPGEPLESVAAWLQSSDPVPQPTANPLASQAMPARPEPGDLAGLRMTATLDAPTPSTAISLLDRAAGLSEPGALDADNAELWFDPFVSDSPSAEGETLRLVEWGTSLDRQSLRVPIHWSRDPDAGDFSFASFPSISADGFFFGWSEPQPPAGFFESSEAARAVCYQFLPHEATAETLRDSQANNWITAPLAGGYAAAVASSRPTSYGHAPFARSFFEALRIGWTLGEALLVSMPMLADGFFLVGDPLMTCAMPREGWDVFGPVASLDRMEPDAPTIRLPANATAWPVPAAGGATSDSVFGVQRSGKGAMTNLASLPVRAAEGEWTESFGVLLWPSETVWRPRGVDGRLEFFVWCRIRDGSPTPMRAVLEREAAGDGSRVEEVSLLLPPTSGRLVTRLDPPSQTSRYRWSVRDATGVERAVSLWSTWLEGTSSGSIPLTLLESA
ncbi:MAG: hypothetical protein ACOC3G_03575 [Phycisphaeraceae bacterium]